jgi:membrane protein DedA with SNARE-associated domain
MSIQSAKSHGGRVTRALSVLLVAGGVGGLIVFAYLGGAESLASALTRITWWQFLLVCAVYGVGVIADTLGWRYALGRDQTPRFLRLLAAKCAGEAVILRQPPATVDRLTRAFRAHQLAFVWSARFLPELNPVAAGLSGMARVGLVRFLLYASGSALAWAGAWVGVGFLLAGSIAESPNWLGIPAAVWVAIGVTAVTVTGVILAGWRSRHRPDDETEAATEPRVRLAA